jgi:glycosyltransferase involved in cell wall biosynthesis
MLKLSVVLATYNRAETLRTTLDHLARQDLDPATIEVIVIDDDSPDHTRRVVEETAATFPSALTYLHHENHGPGYTQNRGIRAAKAPLVLLMADDIWLAPGALRAHLDEHARHPEPQVAVLGKVLQSPAMNRSIFLKHWDPFGLQDLAGSKELPCLIFWVYNISVKRDFLLQNGLFRETVGRAGPSDHHDTELGYRLSQHGLRILYNEDAWGYHYHPSTLEQALDRYYERGLNWAPFRKRAPAPEAPVLAHLLNARTLGDHIRVLRSQDNHLYGKERYLSWHIARELFRSVMFNRLTVPWFWQPLVARAETSPMLARLMNRRIYRSLTHYHLKQGIRDGRKRFGD